MISIIQRINKLCSEISGWMLCIIAGLLLADVIGRSLNYSMVGLSSLAMFVMVATVYLGLSNCEMMNEHAQVKILLDKMSLKLKRAVYIFIYSLSATIIAISAYAMTINAKESFKDLEAIAGMVPYWLFPVKFIMVFGLWLYFIQIVINLLITIFNIPKDSQSK